MQTATDTATKAKRGRGRPRKRASKPTPKPLGVPERIQAMIAEIESIVPILRDRGENWNVGSLESVKGRLNIILLAVTPVENNSAERGGDYVPAYPEVRPRPAHHPPDGSGGA